MTLRSAPERRPMVVRRIAPHLPGLGRHKPKRPPVSRYIPRCSDQKARSNQRGGTHGFFGFLFTTTSSNPRCQFGLEIVTGSNAFCSVDRESPSPHRDDDVADLLAGL